MATETPISELNGRDDASFESGRPERGGGTRDEVSVLDLLIILAERKRLIFLITVAFALLAVAVSFLLPKRYTATVILLPPQQGSPVGMALASELGSMGGLGSTAGGGGLSALAGSALGIGNTNDMYVAMLRSETVENAMVQQYGLLQEYHKHYLTDARKKFEHYSTANGNGKDRLIHISVEDHDPRRAADLANGYVAQFRKLTEHLAITEAAQRRVFFAEQLKQANQKLESAEEAFKETEQKTGFIELSSQARALIEAAATIRAQIVSLETQIQGMRTYAAGQNAQLARAEQELDGLRGQLARLTGSEQDLGGLIVPKGQVPAASIEYMRKLRDVEYYQSVFNHLAAQLELARLDEAKEGALVQVVDPAIPPDKKSSPKRMLIVACSTFLGLLIGIFVALWQASLQRMKLDSETSSKLDILRRACSISKHKHGNLHS
jgi:tyrosine-protein kinase Etk/Wzc